jgi:predicted dehydrogenase/threonine dehydrogenase-like Zn-dependent dehydrogenase
MKQLIQSFKTGELGIFDVPVPICQEGGVLVKTTASLVSAGTEKMLVDFAKKSLLSKARNRPDLVAQVISKMKKEGIKNTLEKVFTKLDTPIPLGYSCAGEVIEVGSSVSSISLGHRVACGGAGVANHSQVNFVPQNLLTKIPDGVDDIDASFVTVGSIALQGVRQANVRLGEKVAVIGLGLLGQLTLQILKASGCSVICSDIDSSKLDLALRLGANEVCDPDDLIKSSNQFSNGYGVDSVIITASTSSNQIIVDAGDICRMRATVVVVGVVGMNIPRDIYYKKELSLKLSMSYGPGRYDPLYEYKGIDYPYDLVRWTSQRNFAAFLDLIAQKKVTPKDIITHQFDFDDALMAYDLLEGRVKEPYLGIVLNYSKDIVLKDHKRVEINQKTLKNSKINIGLIGAGNFTQGVILPNIKKINDYELVGLCTATGISSHSNGLKNGFKYITTDYNEIYKDKDINSVIITTIHSDHGSKVIEAIKNKKHCFVEKPLCIKESQLEQIKELYSFDTILQVGFNRRFSPFIKQMRQVLGNTNMSINYRINAGIIPKDHWIQDPLVGGGRVLGEVCHFIDTCSYLTNSSVKSVFASCVSQDDSTIVNEDNITIILNYQNGSIATITYYAYGNNSMPKEYIEVFSNGLSLVLDDFRQLTIYDKKIYKKRTFNQDKGFLNEFIAFKDSIYSSKSSISFDTIYNTSKASFKILESLKTNSLIKIYE